MLIDELGGKSLNELEERRSKKTTKTKSAVFHSAQYMLLGTHPIPARSPAEREGQTSKEMRTEGGGQRRGRGGGTGTFVVGGDGDQEKRWMGRGKEGRNGGRQRKKIEGRGRGDSRWGLGVFIHEGRGREKM